MPGLDPNADSFQEPASPDTTSAPSVPPLPAAGVLKKLKAAKIKGGPNQLAAAIARARRAKQGGRKYG